MCYNEEVIYMNMKEFNKVDISKLDIEDRILESIEKTSKQVKRLNKQCKAQNKKEA